LAFGPSHFSTVAYEHLLLVFEPRWGTFIQIPLPIRRAGFAAAVDTHCHAVCTVDVSSVSASLFNY